MERSLSFCARIVFAATFFAAVHLTAGAQVQTSPEITQGMQWLISQIQADGHLQNESRSIATDLQNRTEVAFALDLLSSPSIALNSVIDVEERDNTEYLSRRIIARAMAGNDATDYISALIQRQNPDGGFGGAVGYESSVIDTAWSVLAFAQAGKASTINAANARSYLASQISLDGSMDIAGSDMRLQGGSIALMALQTAPDASNADAVRRLSVWLLQQQDAAGAWNGNAYLSALTLLAVSPVTSDDGVRARARSYLMANRSSNGSWNDDPFLTALVLRAFASKYVPQVNANGGVLKGTVLDRATNAPLANVAISIGGNANPSVSSDGNGSFMLNGLATGTYSVTFSRSGYGITNGTYSLVAGQTTDAGNIAMAQLANGAIVRGQIVAAGSNVPLSGATVTIKGAATQSVTTNSAGQYEFDNVVPGAVAITVTLPGYQAVSANGTTSGGQTLIFSPTLYADGQALPNSVRYIGTVVGGLQNIPLSGAAVQITGAQNVTSTTAATGKFDISLNPGSYSVTVSAGGYQSITQTFTATAGETMDGGVISLFPLKTTSSVRGRVASAANVGIAGALVQIVGTSVMTKTAADGSYSISDLQGTNFTVRASATGYDSQTYSLQLSSPNDITQNFVLSVSGAAPLAIGDLTVSPSTAGSNADISVDTVIYNRTTVNETAVLQLQITDGNGKFIGNGRAYGADGSPIGLIAVPAGASLPVRLVWNTAQASPGSYSLDVRLAQADSITRSNPQGTLIAEKMSGATVNAQTHFKGTASAYPPVLQAGQNTSVKLSAIVLNDGNIKLPAQDYTLKIISRSDGSIAYTQQVSAQAIELNGLQSLAFSDWTPTNAGNFDIELTGTSADWGKATGTLYVGDAAKATYSVGKTVVPPGTQSVRASINVTGQDAASGTISDPLAPFIKAAIQKAIPTNYAGAVNDTISTHCLRCHVQSQALVAGELTRKLTDTSEIRAGRDTILNAITSRQLDGGAIDGYDLVSSYWPRSQSMLSMWALSTWHDKKEIISTLAKGADYLVSIQNPPDGAWYPDYQGGWWGTPVGTTSFNMQSLVSAAEVLKDASAPRPVSYTSSAWFSQGLVSPSHLAQDSSGNVYVTNYNTGQIVQVKPDGSSSVFVPYVPLPTASLMTKAGNFYIATDTGLYKRNPDGSVTLVTSHRANGLAEAPDGDIYFSCTAESTIYKLTGDGSISFFVAYGPVSNPVGIAFAENGDLLVADSFRQNISRYHPDATMDIVVAWTGTSPHHLTPYKSGWLVSTDKGLIYYNQDWHGEKILYTKISGVTVLADGTILVSEPDNNRILSATSSPIDTQKLTASIDHSMAIATNWILQDSTADVQKNMDLAQRLIGLSAARRYYQGQPLANTIQEKMQEVGTQLRGHLRSDGGWGYTTFDFVSDALVTAQVGVALDNLNPSASDPIVQNAVKWLLAQQRSDGNWYSNAGLFSTPFATTSWVSIWLPTLLDRLGGIDTDVTVTFPPNVAMSNPDTAPAITTANPDGSTTFKWSLTGVTSAGQSINYDLALADMAVGEVRPVSTDAHLTFKNTFTNGVVDAPINIPRVTASAFLSLGVGTDKTSYPADTAITITGQVTNTGAGLSAGTVKFDAYASDNTLITSLGAVPFSNLAPGASANVTAVWNTSTTLAGTGYYVLGSLYDSANRFVGNAQARFDIASSGSASTKVTGRITTDKQLYLPNEAAKISDLVTNTTVNAPLNGLSIFTKVFNSDGSLRFTVSETLAQLLQGNTKSYGYSVPLQMAPAGQYSATLTVTATDGTVLTQSSTTFNVASSSTTGSGLAGTITASPKQVPMGEAAVLSFNTRNLGNSIFTNLPLTVSIVDPLTQTVLAQYPYAPTLAIGADYAAASSWASTGGKAGSTYVAVLSAMIGGKSIVLSQDTFTLIAPPIKLDIEQVVVNGNRVLVLVSCNDGETDACGPNGQLPVCVTQRSQIIDHALTALGVTHTITTNEADFKREFRSGVYNTYWISGKEDKLHDDLTEEIREAVYGGDGLLIDGQHDQRNKVLDTVTGITWKGKIGQTGLPVDISGPIFTAQRLMSVNRADKLVPNGSTSQAVFAGSQANGNGPAILADTYGAGRAVEYAFDLPLSLNAQTAWQGNLASALQYVLPAQLANLVPGGIVPVKTSVANLANMVDIDLKSTLPNGASYLGSNPAATVDGKANTIDWVFNLPANQSRDTWLTFRAPGVTGDSELQTVVSTVKAGTLTPYGNLLSVPITVTAAGKTSADVIGTLNALQLSQKQDQKTRSSVIADVQAAMTAMSKNTATGYETAIGQLVQATDLLAGMTVDTSVARQGIDRILREAQWRWSQLPH